MQYLPRILMGALLLSGCSSNGDDGIDTPLDPDVAPVTEGDWYRPEVATTWQWQLLLQVNPDYQVDAYDIDLFDSDASLIADLQAAGKIVICYFSAGSSEDWRPDFDQFESDDMGGPLDDSFRVSCDD